MGKNNILGKICFVLTWLAIFFSAAPYIHLFPESIAKINRASQWVTIIAGLMTILHILFTGWLRKYNTAYLLVFVYFAWCIVTLFWSVNTDDTLYYLLLSMEFLVLMLLVWQHAWSIQRLHALFFAYVLGTIWVSIDVFRSYLNGDVLKEPGYERYTSGTINANDMAVLLVFGVALAIFLLYQSKSRLVIISSIACLAVSLPALVLTGSRGGFISLMVALFFSLRVNKYGRIAMLVIGLAAIVLVNSPLSPMKRFTTITENTRSLDFGDRWIIWESAFRMISAQPFIGQGAGTFQDAITAYLGYQKAPHNSFVSIWAGSGLIGLIIFIAMLLYSFLQRRQYLSPVNRNLVATLLIILIVTSLTLGQDREKITWLCLAFVSALAYARSSSATRPLLNTPSVVKTP